MLVAYDDVLFIVFVLSVDIRFLDAPARRSVVPRHGKVDETAVGEGDGFLYQSLAERAPSDDDSTVIVLYRS